MVILSFAFCGDLNCPLIFQIGAHFRSFMAGCIFKRSALIRVETEVFNRRGAEARYSGISVLSFALRLTVAWARDNLLNLTHWRKPQGHQKIAKYVSDYKSEKKSLGVTKI